MSRKYNGLIALITKSQEGSIDDLISNITKDIESAGGKVENVENLGRKDFANTPRKISGAHYVNFTVSGDADLVVNVEEKLALNTAVYLNQFNRVA